MTQVKTGIHDQTGPTITSHARHGRVSTAVHEFQQRQAHFKLADRASINLEPLQNCSFASNPSNWPAPWQCVNASHLTAQEV